MNCDERRPLPGTPRPEAHGTPSDSVESNTRLTAMVGAVLFVLLAGEGVTILRVHSLLSAHVFIGMLLIPPVALKIASTAYRFVRYYSGAPAYRRRGAPPLFLRLLGPLVVVLTVAVLGSGVALLVAGASWRPSLLLLHKASFVIWFGAMALHVLAHSADMVRWAPRDFIQQTRRSVAGATFRLWTVAVSLGFGIPLGILLLPDVGRWMAASSHIGH